MNDSGTGRVKPPPLRRGDTVAVIAPGSPIKRELLIAGCEELRRLGYRPLYHDSILERDLYFAGSAQRRARELEEMFQREEVRAIVCARGGYGCNYLLDKVDVDLVRRHPKILMGYSDVTTLLTWLTDSAHLVTFHGPMVTKDFAAGAVDQRSWTAALEGDTAYELNLGRRDGVEALVEGRAEGVLYGGCLSMLAASLGTPYEIQTAGTILFLEDVAAKPFQIDRMLMQLRLGGKLAGVRGIMFGEMLDCTQPGEQSYRLQEVIKRMVSDLGVPVAYGLRSGHVTGNNITLPLGVRAVLEVGREQMSLRTLEPATIPAREPARSAKI